MKFELYKEVYERIREKCDLIINLTTGAGGRLLYDSAGNTWNTSELKSPEERVEHIVRLKPELCSLDVGTLNFGPRFYQSGVHRREDGKDDQRGRCETGA
jgi:uncharacterized protein (DUF849 family)